MTVALAAQVTHRNNMQMLSKDNDICIHRLFTNSLTKCIHVSVEDNVVNYKVIIHFIQSRELSNTTIRNGSFEEQATAASHDLR